MYPGTLFEWHNMSTNVKNKPIAVDNSPLFFTISSFDKGPEDLREVKGTEFYSLYGTKMKFASHGQPALQAANIIDHGGRLLIKRLVANDAYLANLIGVATVSSDIHALKTEDEVNGRTLEELLTGVAPEPKEYAEILTITSTVGAAVGTTSLLVDPAIGMGHTYYWRETDTEVLPELGTTVDTSTYTAWDGSSDIEVADGTKIELIEYSNMNGILSYGVINVTSALDHPMTTSVVPDNGLNALYMTSKESLTTEGNTIIIMSPAAGVGNKLFYMEAADPEALVFPDPDLDIAAADFAGWTAWDGSTEISIADGTTIIVFEVTEVMDTMDTSLVHHYTPVKAAAIKCVSKLPADTRESESVIPVAASVDKYIIDSQENHVKWSAMTVEHCKTKKDVAEEAATLLVEKTPTIETVEDGITIHKESDYPLYYAVDNGRGVSIKAIRFAPDLAISKSTKTMMYTIGIFEGTTQVEPAYGALDPSCVYGTKLYGLNVDTASQVIFDTIPGIYDKYISHLSLLTGYSEEFLIGSDVMFMTNNKGTSLSNISLDPESIDFGAPYGVQMQSGDNGEFGDKPFGTEAYTEAAMDVIDNDDYSALWDPDTYPVFGIFDANFPEPVKDKFAWYATEREDTMFFRDYGIDIFSYAAIREKSEFIDPAYKNFFNTEYFTTYEIFDPETRVRERVTMMYDFAAAMVQHFSSGAYRPAAGEANGMILESAIKGTINFTPYNKPLIKQKDLIDELHVNYAVFQGDQLIVQSLYTADMESIETNCLIWLNNVLAVEEVQRAVRRACPKKRYTFVTSGNFSTYAEDVNNVLKNFRPNFKSLSFGYVQNELKESQKIYEAGIYFQFNGFAQTEYFHLYTLADDIFNK